MAQPSDLEARVAALEARVGELAGEARAAREDAAAARHLAAANDRDMAEARRDIRDFRQATAASFNAMRSDLTDLQTEMRSGFTQVRGQLDGAAVGIEQITSLLRAVAESGRAGGHVGVRAGLATRGDTAPGQPPHVPRTRSVPVVTCRDAQAWGLWPTSPV